MINDSNSLNEQQPNVKAPHSTFPQERHVFGTYRFGEYSPFFYFDGIPSDRVRQRCITTTRSMSLSAPLMEDIKLKRDYFIVPYQALLPRNWEKVYVNPKKGDDVIASTVGPFVKDFPYKVSNLFVSLFNEAFASPAEADFGRLLKLFRVLVFGELFFSNGCLLSTLGVHLSPGIVIRYYSPKDTRARDYSLDRFIDAFCTDLLATASNGSYVFRYNIGSGSSSVDDIPYEVTDSKSMRLFLSRLREGDVREIFGEMSQSLATYLSTAQYLPTVTSKFNSESGATYVDLARCSAYQICCAHYYSNDNIDYIYSAELYRDYIGSLVSPYLNGENGDYFSSYTFSYNGASFQYDWLSAYIFDSVISTYPSIDSYTLFYPYFFALFGFKRSLRFVDYFAGGRKEPLAVGDPNVAVNNNLVSVVDINRMTQYQRLWNNILRLPSQIEGYVKGLFPGAAPNYDYHNPAWLAHTTDVVFTAEVENTADAQTSDPNSVTATFRGNSSDKEFTIDVDFPGIIIGIQYFDIRRAYFTGIDRLVQHQDRFDMALPELQYIGDQEIRGSELLSWLGPDPISYTGRNMEYKQVVDQAFGGFVESLPGWSFLFDPRDWRIDNVEYGPLQARISSDFIRSLNVELDDYFIKLSNFSLGTYFHFQQKIVNITEAKRALVKDPQILG